MRAIHLLATLALGLTLCADVLAQDSAGAEPAAAAPPPKPKAGAGKKKPATKAAPDTASDAPKPDAPGRKGRPPGPGKPATRPANPEASPVATSSTRATHEVVERESHIEFDERLVHGQTAAGAIYLFQRAPSEFKSVVQPPESFRARTTGLLLSDRPPP